MASGSVLGEQAQAPGSQGHRAMELIHGHHWSQAIAILDSLVGQDDEHEQRDQHEQEQEQGPEQWLAARGQCHMQLGCMHLAVKDCAQLLQLCYKNKRPLPEAGRNLLIAARSSPHSLSPALAPLLNQLHQLQQLHQHGRPDQGQGRGQSQPRQQPQSCTYCALTFSDKAALRAHCSTEDHQRVIMSDEGELEDPGFSGGERCYCIF